MRASTSGEKLLLKELLLDSRTFFVSVRGELGRKKGSLEFQGRVKPIERGNFFMEAVTFNGDAQVNLPYLFFEAQAFEPKIRVVEEEFSDIKGKIVGEGELFRSLVATGEFTNREVILRAEYNIIPKNHLTFSYENLRLTEKTFGLGQKVEAVLRGEGEILFRERKLSVWGSGSNIVVGRDTFGEGVFDFSYIFGGEGELKAELYNSGRASLNLRLGRGKLKGEASVENYKLSINDLKGILNGNVTFRKSGQDLEVDFLGNLINPEYRGVDIPTVSFTGRLKNSELFVNLKGQGVRADISGKPDNLIGEIYFRNFTLRQGENTLNLSYGVFHFEKREKVIKGKGNFEDLRLFSGNLKLATSGKVSLSKKDVLNLKVKGELSAFFGDKVIDDSLRYAFGVEGNLIDLRGVSDKTKLRLNYNLTEKKGSFGGEYNARQISAHFWGTVKEEGILGEGKLRIRFLEDYVKLSGNFEAKKDHIKIKLKPYRYSGKLLSYRFRGFEFVKEGEGIYVLFGGLDAKFLRRPILIVSEAKGEGNLKRIDFSPIKLEGIMNGTVNISYKKGLRVNSKGEIDLTLLSKNVASLIKSKLEGSINYEFQMRGKDFKLIATTEQVVKIRSTYFYEPFIGAVNLEAKPSSMMFSMVNWFKEGYLNAYAITTDYKNFDINFMFEKAPVKYYTKELKVALLADGKGKVGIKNFKKISLKLNTSFDGTVRVLKIPEAKEKKETKLPVEFSLNAEFRTKTGLNVKLPEGRLLTALKGKVYGRYPDINYDIFLQVKSGKVSYFGKDFIVKGGKLELHKREEEEERYVDLELNTWEEPYKIFLKVKGELDHPEVYYFSEPPLSRREILLKLIGGGGNNAVLPVATALSQELKQVGAFKGTLERLFDVKIGIGIQTASTGELGAAIDLRKRISRLFSIKYRLSTLKDKRATYWELEANPPVDADIGFYFFLYSDETSEYRLGYRKEFNF